MNLEHYRQRLLAVHQETLTRLERAVASVSEPSDGVPHDTGDESSSGELRYQQLAGGRSNREQLINAAADAGDATVATSPRARTSPRQNSTPPFCGRCKTALRRIENVTYGQPLIDDGPIDPKRLDAVLWAPYCIRHHKLLEAASRPHSTP
jgi:RNA polymerase-binding transcription factor DksA